MEPTSPREQGSPSPSSRSRIRHQSSNDDAESIEVAREDIVSNRDQTDLMRYRKLEIAGQCRDVSAIDSIISARASEASSSIKKRKTRSEHVPPLKKIRGSPQIGDEGEEPASELSSANSDVESVVHQVPYCTDEEASDSSSSESEKALQDLIHRATLCLESLRSDRRAFKKVLESLPTVQNIVV